MSGPRIAVIIPAYQEAALIARTIAAVPNRVREIIVVDDASTDGTGEAALTVMDPRVHVLSHETNQGVGAAIYSGYRHALLGSAEFFVVMAGDNQMDGGDLDLLLTPFSQSRADYVKGDRLSHPEAMKMPRLRRYGTRLLAWCTSKAAGFPLRDTQCGYTAISRHAAQELNWSEMWPRYGYPNDLLLFLIARGKRVVETPVRPVYAGEKSGLRPWHLLSILGVIARRYWLERSRVSTFQSTPEEKLLVPGE